MSKGIIGKKLGMTSVFTEAGQYCPVTVIEAGPCTITQVKNKETDGYNALQLGFGDKKKSKTNKPLMGHFRKSGENFFILLKEFEVDDPSEYSCGQQLRVDMFQPGTHVNVSGISKGRGFSGVMKRHGFSGGRKTHGSHSLRIPGSIGSSAWPSRVAKGKKMPGHYGVRKHTIRNLEVIDVRVDKNLLLIKGPVPGAKSGFLMIRKPKIAKQ